MKIQFKSLAIPMGALLFALVVAINSGYAEEGQAESGAAAPQEQSQELKEVNQKIQEKRSEIRKDRAEKRALKQERRKLRRQVRATQHQEMKK